MKIGFSPNYYVQVFPDGWEEDPADEALWEGVVTVLLNTVVTVRFVPDVSEAGPPWRGVPAPGDVRLTTPAEVREYMVITSGHVVTPNARQAGRVEQIKGSDRVRLIFYVSPEEFAVFTTELAELADIASDANPSVRREDVLDRAVIRFLDERFLGDPRVIEESGPAVGRAQPR